MFINPFIAVGNDFGISGENERDAHAILFLGENNAIITLQSSQVYSGRGNDMEVEIAFDSGWRIQLKNTDLDHLTVTVPKFGSDMTVTREERDWSGIPVIHEAINKSKSMFPHTTGHGHKQWEGHYGREFPPSHHEWGCLEAIATGQFRFGNWIDSWIVHHKRLEGADTNGTVMVSDGVHQMSVMDSAEKSDRGNNIPFDVNLSY